MCYVEHFTFKRSDGLDYLLGGIDIVDAGSPAFGTFDVFSDSLCV